MVELKPQCVYIKIAQEKFMDTQKVKKHRSKNFDWDNFSQHVRDSYGSVEQPDYSFTHEYFREHKYPRVLDFIKRNFSFSEDTEPNTDVSYGYVLKKDNDRAALQISFVGPYFYLSAILPDGSMSDPDFCFASKDAWHPFLEYMRAEGFIYTSGNVLRRRMLFGNAETSVYEILILL